MITYRDLGVTPLVNASGTITTLGGSLMRPEVLKAMTEASKTYVDLYDLNIKAGQYLAQCIGVEAAHISCGAASGMQLVAAACLTGADADRVERLPHTRGWRNRFVISLVDSHTYIHQGIEMCGGKLVRAGSRTDVAAADILSGIDDRTAAVVHFLGRQSWEQLEEVVAGARQRNVPVIVDAAAQLPPRTNLVEILAVGAAAVVFSGGKGMRGPQNTGLVLGNKATIQAVRINASPHNGIGRGMKVGKEEIVGLVQAVELFLSGSDDEDLSRWRQQAETAVAALRGLPGVRASVVHSGQRLAPDVPRALIEAEDQSLLDDAVRSLRSGDPSIAVYRNSNGIVIDFMTLEPGEESMLAERLQKILSNG
jgi:uncharacterized pyridoxal phosphate-dependent enzyme